MIHRLQEIQSIYISQNRLVEGKDYVRAEWLKGDRSAYINTNYLLDFDDIKTSIFRLYNNYNQIIEGTRYEPNPTTGGAGTVFGYALVSNTRNTYGSFFSPNGAMARWNHNIPVNEENIVIMSKNGITLNDSSIYSFDNAPIVGTRFKSVTPYLIFASWVHNWQIDDRRQKVDYKSFEIEGKLHLIPCQLLRSIPATLDANGIARSAGECGMIDSISGKFYGNVASSGSFTVENLDESGTVEDTRLHQIYRNKLVKGEDYMVGEMLKGTGGCYIDTLINPAWNDQLSATTNVRGQPTVGNPVLLKARGTNTMIGIVLGAAWHKYNVPQILAYQKVTDTDDYYEWMSFPASAEIYVSIKVINNAVPITSCKIDEVSWTYVYTKGTNVITDLPDTTYKIGDTAMNGLDVLNLKDIKINSHNFVPCRLLRPIPRNLDAQCKSRVAGECGMIDLISGRFYGNVASSGAFSLEWDKWLKDCSIKFNPETTLGYNTSIPNDYVIYGRIEVAKLTAQYTDFGFMQASNNYIILGESTVYAISDWGTNKWATFVVSYSGGYECSLQLNGVTLTTVTQSTPYNEAPHIQLHGIMQINKIEHTFYPDESDPTQSQSEVWKRFVEEDGRQGLGITDMTYKIYAD